MFKHLLIVMLLAGGSASAAPQAQSKPQSQPQFGVDVGNGGDGVIIGGKKYLLDLVEAGVYKRPYVGEVRNEALLKRIKKIFADLNLKDPSILERKMLDINKSSGARASAILAVMEMYNWAIVDRELLNVPDEDSLLSFNNLPLIQLAIRRHKYIRINEAHWSALDAVNQAALILHEAVYASIKLEYLPLPGKPGEYRLAQSSARVRDIIGYLFNPKFDTGVWDSIVGDYLPKSYAPYSLTYDLKQVGGHNDITQYYSQDVAFGFVDQSCRQDDQGATYNRRYGVCQNIYNYLDDLPSDFNGSQLIDRLCAYPRQRIFVITGARETYLNYTEDMTGSYVKWSQSSENLAWNVVLGESFMKHLWSTKSEAYGINGSVVRLEANVSTDKCRALFTEWFKDIQIFFNSYDLFGQHYH